jgi:cytochrome c biogenesis protein CcdA
MTPLGKVAQGQTLWRRCVVAYIAAGSVSAIVIGLLLGEIGRVFTEYHGRDHHLLVKLYIVSVLSLLLAAREWGWINFRLPEARRQSEKAWAHRFGFVTASAMWGFHIGLGFATRINFGGFWVLVVLALAMANPCYGAVLILLYWWGRALPVWIGPKFVASVNEAAEFPTYVLSSDRFYHRVAGLVLAWLAVAIALSVMIVAP